MSNTAVNNITAGEAEAVVAGPQHAPATASDNNRLGQQLHDLAALNDLVALVSSADSPAKACRRLATELKQWCRADMVAISLADDRQPRVRLVATSEEAHLDLRSELALAMTAASQESAARTESADWPPLAEGNRHALLAHKRLANLLDHSLYSLPFPDALGRHRGVCLITRQSSPAVTPEQRQFLSAASVPLGSTLRLVQQAAGNRCDRLARKLQTFISSRRAGIAALLAMLVLGLALLPMRYRVKCACELQPVVRRFIAAPFDARLETSLVQPGEVVAAGQVLARIDARDIQWELSAKEAEAQRVETELAGYVASHESGKAQIAQLEHDRIQIELDELEYQAEHLEIRTPLAGIVLLGDHAKLEGVPLERGKTLFEVAPLDALVVEVEIAEDDVRFVKPGQSANIRLDAFPLLPITGEIKRVHPRSEIRENANVFVAEINCENSSGQWRPGMRGTAKIDTVYHPLVWNYFHKPFAKALVWLGI